MLAVIAIFVVGYLVIGYLLLSRGLTFVHAFPVVGPLLTRRVLHLIYLFFFVMLIFSNMIVAYSALFRSRETTWLLTLPVNQGEVLRWKFGESLIVSSWALLFLSAPLLTAWGRVMSAPIEFYFFSALALIPFVVLPAVIGHGLIFCIVRLGAAPWMKIGFFIGAAFAIVGIGLAMNPRGDELVDAYEQEVVSFERLLEHTQISTHPALPSNWISRANLAWSQGLQQEGWFWLAVLLSYACMSWVLLRYVVSPFFYGSWLAASHNRAHRAAWEEASRRPRAESRPWLEKIVHQFTFLRPGSRALLIKDLRLFWRDPVQWSQFLVFFGLLAIYVANLRNVSVDLSSPFWAVTVSYLNMGACALTLSTLTTRFVYPQLSLEGRRIWILGMAPMGLKRVMWQKFLGSAIAAMTITLMLMVATSVMLNLPFSRVIWFALAVSMMSFSLSALAVGLGALFPNLREDNPAKIVSGFGGTLCLVLSFIYVLLMMTCLVMPVWVEGPESMVRGDIGLGLLALSGGAAALISLITGGIPMMLASKKIDNFEL